MHPQAEQQSIFRTVFAGWLRFEGIFGRSVRATTKKGRQLFGQKSAPPGKILATPMSVKQTRKKHDKQMPLTTALQRCNRCRVPRDDTGAVKYTTETQW